MADAPPLPLLLSTLALTTAILTARGAYKAYVRRIPTATHLRLPSRPLFGRAAAVNDGDNVRLYHTPLGLAAGWGWLRRPPSNLKDQTIHIRIAGIDAPELAHFGRPAQPHSDAALAHLRGLVRGRRVRVVPLAKDQYGRVVGAVLYRRWGIPGLPLAWMHDVGLEMLRAGMATVYEAKSGAEYWGRKDVYLRAQAQAQARRRGMWRNAQLDETPSAWRRLVERAGLAPKREELESPRDYKRRMKQ